jgi:hypothetical protein
MRNRDGMIVRARRSGEPAAAANACSRRTSHAGSGQPCDRVEPRAAGSRRLARSLRGSDGAEHLRRDRKSELTMRCLDAAWPEADVSHRNLIGPGHGRSARNLSTAVNRSAEAPRTRAQDEPES